MKETNSEKKIYEEPTVTAVEFDFNDTVVTAFSGECKFDTTYEFDYPECFD